MTCEHEAFGVMANIHRLTDEAGKVTGFQAEIGIKCSVCGRQFQFLGLRPGVDSQGARISVDGLEARLAICPQGLMPSPLDQMAVNFPTERRH